MYASRKKRGRKTDELIEFLTDDAIEQQKLRQAISVAWNAAQRPLTEIQDAYQLLGWYYALAKDKKRRLKRSAEDPEIVDQAQKVEDLFESLVKGTDRALMVRQHLNKYGGSIG